MDAKIITGLLLCVYLMTCISLSQSASDEFNSRLRFRRQDAGIATGATTDDVDEIDAGYDDNDEENPSEQSTVVPGDGADKEDDAIPDEIESITTTTMPPKADRTTPSSSSDDVDYYDEEDDDEESNTDSGSSSGSNTQRNVTRGNDTEEATVPSNVQPGGRVELRVVVSPDVIQVQRGRTVELTCTVYGGDQNTNIYWIQDEPERRHALIDSAGENDKQVTASQVILRSRITLDDPSKIGKYTCMAQDASQNTGSASVTMQEGAGYYPQPTYPGGVVPGPAPSSGGRGYLRIIAPVMTEGDYVEITCEGAAPEDESSIQWYFNNKVVGDEQPLFPRGKTLHIRPISRPYLGNYRCTVPGAGYTDANSVLTFAGAGGSSDPIPVGPVQPSGRCSIDEATCRNGRCIPRAYLCDGKNDCGDNSDETCSQPSGSGTDICQPNEIRCSDTSRGRKCVQKFWMCDGDRDCDDGSDEQQHWCELLPRQRFCKPSEFQCASANGTYGNPVCVPRSFQCDGYNDCPDRSDEIGCTKPTIISPPQRQVEINAGETLTIQCTARGSPAPYINWRLNWGQICGDGSDNGRCTMAQSLDANDPSVVTGTLTVRNVNGNDGGAYSCEALNNQGFIFAIPDAIVNVIIAGPVPQPPSCSCNGHSTSCSSDGRCLNCQHNTAGYNCEHCAPGYQGDARRGTPQDCQYVAPLPLGNCDPSGTHMERGGRCICKYNVEGDRCDRCKHNHFYLNPTTPNGCLPCFCSGVSSECRSSDWRRQAVSLSLENDWNAVPKNFATERYEAGSKIQRRQNGRELALDQNSLGRPANEVLYWKAPKEALGDVVTLYDGNIDIHFTNDGNDQEAPSNDEFIWLRGNNIDLVHKLPSTQRFKANTNATYSVPCNERTFTRKDGTHIDRENILMALSDLDTFLVKINPIGGRRNAVLRGVTLNVAARDGYADSAPTVESCSCPANYTGTSCEKCAQGYGRPHPLVGIYLGQCWSCRSLCHERSDQCDRETGKCSNCQGNSEGDRCERCHAGYVLDPRSNQCTREDQYVPYPGSEGTGSRGSYFIGERPYGGEGSTPLRIVLDSNQPEQRIPLQILNIQPQSVVWGRTDGRPLPSGVFQENNDLVIRNPSNEQSGNYVCTITHPDGTIERIPVYLDYPGQGYPGDKPQPVTGGLPHISIQPRVINLKEGQRMIVQYTVGSHEPIEVTWEKLTDQGYQPIPSLFTVEPNRLVLQRATPDAAGTYRVVVRNSHGEDKQELRINVEPRRGRNRGPQVRFPQSQYEIGYGEVVDIAPNIAGASGATIVWSKDGSTNLPQGVTARDDGFLRIEGHSQDVAGQYSLDVTNARGRISTPLVVRWKDASSQQGQQGQQGQHGADGQDHQRSYIQVYLQSRDEQSHQVGRDIYLQCTVQGSVERPYEFSFTKDGRPLENNVEVHPDGLLLIRNAQAQDAGRYRCEVNFPRTPEAGTQESSYDLRLDGASASGYEQNYQHGGDHGQQSGHVEVTVEPSEVTLQRGQKATITCRVKGADQYKVTWGQYAHDTSLPSFARQEGNDVIIAPTADTPDSQTYFQCQVDIPGQGQPNTAYAPVNIQGGDQSTILRRPKLFIEPSTHIRVSEGDKLRIRCFDPYETYRTAIRWFRKGDILITLLNQHSNGILDFDSISESDIGQYICRGRNRVGYTEETVTIEIAGSPPSIDIAPKMHNGYLQVPFQSRQTIACLNQDNHTAVDITWRRADIIDYDLSRTPYLFPPNMPLQFEHNGTYVCIATNKYGSTSKTIIIDIQNTSYELSIDIEPTDIFPINTEIHLNCKLPHAQRIWWSSINHRRRENNPLQIRAGLNSINKRFVCHARDMNGKLQRKIVRIQRYSQEQLIAVIANNTIDRSLHEKNQKIKPSEVYIKLVTASDEIKEGEVIDIYCYVEGLPPKKLSWSFQSGLLPSNTYLTNDGHLFIYNFDKFNLGTYTCSVDVPNKHLSRSIDFQSNNFSYTIEPTLSLQVYSSRSDYYFGGRLVLECISSDPNISTIWIKRSNSFIRNITQSFLFLNKLSRKDIAQYQCISMNTTKPLFIDFNITQTNLLTHTLPIERTSDLHIEFLSSINQLKLNGNILLNCSSTNQTSIRWISNHSNNEILINNSYLHIRKFSIDHFNSYQCINDHTQKSISLSRILFDSINNFNIHNKQFIQPNNSMIEIIQGRYIGDNITLICRIGQDISHGKVVWSNLPKRLKHFYIRGPRLEFRPFKLEHHNQYKCLIKSKRSKDILRRLTFNTYVNIRERYDGKPRMNITIDTSRLLSNQELRLICYTDSLNKYHQWIVNDRIPNTKSYYDLSINDQTSSLIIPEFDLQYDSGKYQCLTKNSFGTTIKTYKIYHMLVQAASTALSTAVILAIAIPCAVVGIGIIICVSICIYCLCCRKPKTTPGMVIHPEAPQPNGYNNPPYNYNNQAQNAL
ncbi:hypothetical protein I4U23_006934 [Adineta vaga]|nr:hypothetical protein I4U23_006934 [Adineta vaga]